LKHVLFRSRSRGNQQVFESKFHENKD